MYLLDTNVLCEVRKLEARRGNARVGSWIRQHVRSDLYLSVIIPLEIERGVLLLKRRDPHQADALRRWLATVVLVEFRDRLLPIDLRVALACAPLHVPDPRPDRDALIAATALVHGMTVVTRNVADFQPMGVSVVNPWQPVEVSG